MKITKLIEVRQTNCRAGANAQPEWTVVFEADGKAFQIERLMQWNTPELHHVQYEADNHPGHFWGGWAKAVVL